MCFALKYIELAEGNGVFLYRWLASGTKEQPQLFCSSTSDQLNWRARNPDQAVEDRQRSGFSSTPDFKEHPAGAVASPRFAKY